MGCFSSKKRPPDSPNGHRTGKLLVYPKLEPCVLPPPRGKVSIRFLESLATAVRRAGDKILAIKKLCSVECAPAGNDTNTKLDEQQVQKPVEMCFAEAVVRSAVEAVNGDEVLAIKMLRFAECAPAGNDTKLWQPDEQLVQKLVEMGFAEAAVRSALEVVNGVEILAIKMLRFAECAPAGYDINTKLWQPDELQVQKLVEMGFAEAAMRSALEVVNGVEILAIKMLRFTECALAGNDTNTKPDEQQVQKPVEMCFAEAVVRSAVEAVNGDEVLAIKMLRFAECAPAGNDTKLWQPDEQLVQKLVEMGFAEAAVRSALEVVNGVEILAIKMLRFAECAPAGYDINTKLWQSNEQQVQKLVEMGFAEAAMRSALEVVNGVEILAIKMLRFAECALAGNDTTTKLWQPDEQQVQKIVEMGFAEAAVRSALEAVNGDEILAIKMLRFAECAPARNYTNTKV